MGFRLQRRIKIAPGINLNISKRGMGVSAGPRGAKVSIGPSGKRASVGVPGTGMRYEVREGWGAGSGTRKPSPSQRRSPAPPPVLPGALRIGFLAKAFKPPDEKAFINGAQALLRGNEDAAFSCFSQVLALNPTCSDACLMLGLLLINRKDDASAKPYLEYVVKGGAADFPWIRTYIGNQVAQFELSITDRVKTVLALDKRSAYLILAEIYQEEGKLEDATRLLEEAWGQGYQDNVLKLSLAELYNDLERDDELIKLAQGTESQDDTTLSILFYLGQAMMREGYQDAAIEILKTALKKRANRDAELLLEVRYVLAQVYESSGKKAIAKKQYEQILAKDYDFRDVQEKLKAL
jgi:tetratricopeptide (TPR) repeat protein